MELVLVFFASFLVSFVVTLIIAFGVYELWKLWRRRYW